MDKEQFEQLITNSGLNLLSDHTPRFLVSLRVGLRIQSAVITFDSRQAFQDATPEQTQEAINTIKTRLLQAAKTKRGDVAQGGEVKVKTIQNSTNDASQVKYPAH